MWTNRLVTAAILFHIATPGLVAEISRGKHDKQAEPSTSAIYRPSPEYPIEARRKGLEGSGVFDLEIESGSGAVRNVKVIKSIGYKVLDSAAIKAFRKWRFPRGQAANVKIPLEFKLKQVSPENAKPYALYTPPPLYPFAARQHEFPQAAYHRSKRSLSSGVFALYLDSDTGKVIDVKILLSTGRKALDDAAISGLRRWRFRSDTPFDVVRVPVTFLGRF